MNGEIIEAASYITLKSNVEGCKYLQMSIWLRFAHVELPDDISPQLPLATKVKIHIYVQIISLASSSTVYEFHR